MVNWNGKTDTIKCLDSLEHASKPKSLSVSIIVVDNGSSDNSAEEIRKKFSSIDIIENNENLGFSGGNNIGIKKALKDGADFIWLLNNDTRVDEYALQALVDSFADEKVGIAGSKIYFSPGREFHKDRYDKSEQGKVIWYAGGLIDWANMYASHRGVDEVDHGQYDATVETPFVTGCSMMVRREVFEKIGLFDERYYLYLEDLDFCIRGKHAGYGLVYNPQSIVWHNNAGSSGVGSELHQYYMTRNRLLMGMRYASARTKFALMREGVQFIINGPRIRRKAVIDAITGKFGKQII